jgi:hypothetical protein
MKIYTNSTPKDTVRNAFYNNLNGVVQVSIASPFFSNSDLVGDVLKNDCFVRLIVVLGPATSPSALQRLINKNNIHIRFFTSSAFHSKLYIFGDKKALVGSANLTQSGMNSNREIAVEIPCDDDAFDNLVLLFQSYWSQAAVLTDEILKKYSQLVDANPDPAASSLANKIKAQFGDIVPAEGIEVGKKKPSKEKLFLADYQRTYQEFLTAYEEVRELYVADGRRQQPENIVPIRIEIDQFFSFVRERFTKGDSYRDEPERNGDDRRDFVKSKIDEWFAQRWKYLDEKIPVHLPRLQRLSSVSTIEKASFEEIVDALDVCHSFHDRLRFYSGGHATHAEDFKKSNDLNEIKKVIAYLLYGKDDYIARMGNCIFSPEYKLNQFGRSAVQELIGWVNKEGIPICNSRTVKALRYLGYGVTVFN